MRPARRTDRQAGHSDGHSPFTGGLPRKSDGQNSAAPGTRCPHCPWREARLMKRSHPWGARSCLARPGRGESGVGFAAGGAQGERTGQALVTPPEPVSPWLALLRTVQLLWEQTEWSPTGNQCRPLTCGMAGPESRPRAPGTLCSTEQRALGWLSLAAPHALSTRRQPPAILPGP